MRGANPPARRRGNGSGDGSNGGKSARYDYVVIGSGPSCAGLVWGLLQQLRQQHQPNDDNVLTIAVVERGPFPSFEGKGEPVSSSSSLHATSRRLSSPSRWFQASHDPHHAHTSLHKGSVSLTTNAAAPNNSNKNNNNNNNPTSSLSPKKASEGHDSDAHSRWERILDVPVGQGVGGTSLINACLCQLPLASDFETWPEPFRSRMMESCRIVQHQLESNRCLLSWRSVNDKDDGDGDDPSSHTIGMTARRQCHNDRDDNRKEHFNSRVSSNPVYRRCTYWEGLFGSAAPLEAPRTSMKGSTTTTSNDDVDDDDDPLARTFRKHVRFVRGQAERLIFDDTNDATALQAETKINRRRRRRRVVGVEISVPSASDEGRVDAVAPPCYRTLYAAREVIACGGALETPALLLVSGIGTRRDPAKSKPEGSGDDNITSCSHLPVGIGLRDHVVLSRAIWTSPTTTAPPPTTVNGVVSLRTVRVENSVFQMGVLEGSQYPSILPVVASGWLRCQPQRNGSTKMGAMDKSSSWLSLLRRMCCVLVSWGLVVVRFFVKAMLRALLACPRYSPLVGLLKRRVTTVSIFLMNPTSTGTVAIQRKGKDSFVSSAAEQPPLRRSDVELDIHLGYLESPEDLDAMRTGWIVSQSLLSEWNVRGVEIFPGVLVRRWTWPFERLWRHRKVSSSEPLLLDKARFRFFAKATCLPYFHWTGSCRMMLHPDDTLGVVGPDLKVRGCDGLRICDASVFPTHVSAPTALTCAALGRVFGSHILDVNTTLS
jgi:choline dehydrogenase-like flavoprotein